MARKQKTIHYLYKTTCDITGRWYIGMHSTHNINDGYMGSGKRLRRSINKYGEDNHTKEILKFFESREQLIEAEKNAITDNMIGDPNCMNLKGGGTGGFFSYESCSLGGYITSKLQKHLRETDPNWVKMDSQKRSEGQLKSYQNGRKVVPPPIWEIKHSEETKAKMRESHKGKHIGEKNSQYGTCWITKDGMNKKIKKEELSTYISKGWDKGRKLK